MSEEPKVEWEGWMAERLEIAVDDLRWAARHGENPNLGPHDARALLAALADRPEREEEEWGEWGRPITEVPDRERYRDWLVDFAHNLREGGWHDHWSPEVLARRLIKIARHLDADRLRSTGEEGDEGE